MIRSRKRGTRRTLTVEVQLLYDVVERLLDDNGGDVEETVNAAASGDEEEEVGEAVEVDVAVVVFLVTLTHNKISEADRGESNEAKVDRLEISPLLDRAVER